MDASNPAIDRGDGALLVVDLQDKLLAAIADREQVVANVDPSHPWREACWDCRSGARNSIPEAWDQPRPGWPN